MPGSRKGFKKLNARQLENFLEFLKIPFPNRVKVSGWLACGWGRNLVQVAHAQKTTCAQQKNHSHSWQQRAEISERNGEVKGEFSWFKCVFFEAIRLWEQQDQFLRKSSQSKLLKMVLESKEINKQLVIVLCQSLIGSCFFWDTTKT